MIWPTFWLTSLCLNFVMIRLVLDVGLHLISRTSWLIFSVCSKTSFALCEFGFRVVCWWMPIFRSRPFYGMVQRTNLLCLHPVLVWKVVLEVRTAMLTYLCHIDLHLTVTFFSGLLSEAWFFSNPSFVCACLVVAWSRRIYVTSATPLINCDTKADPLSEMIVLGKQACLVMIVFRTFSNFMAFQICVRRANNFLKNISMFLTMYSLPPDGGRSEIRSTCMASLSLVLWSLRICSSGRMNLLSNLNSLTHCSHDMTHFLTNFAVFGSKFYVCTQLLFWWFRSSSFTRCFGRKNCWYLMLPISMYFFRKIRPSL